MNRYLLKSVIAFCFSGSISNSIAQNETGDNQYIVGKIPELEKFLILTDPEKKLHNKLLADAESYSTITLENPRGIEYSFANNRARIQIKRFVNGEEGTSNNTNSNTNREELSTFCFCNVQQDTIIVNAAIGFFQGAGISLKIHKNQFTSSYYEYIQDQKVYKKTTENLLQDNISVNSKQQQLYLDKTPLHQQQLTGLLTLTTADFYIVENEKSVVNFAKILLRFTCYIDKP